ncbi:MAG: DinB family protein [Jatrophihabitantaceae bacterium]
MSAPQTPPSDDKDWTWVLDRPCPECGFDASAITGAEVPDHSRAAIAALRSAVLAPGSDVRPKPDVWSALEYGCHVRDVCIIFGTRVESMIAKRDPTFPNWDQDETARTERYWEQERAKVAGELAVEGERIAEAFASVREDEWNCTGRRSDGSVFTIDTLARYFLHDVVHHVHDVTSD